MAVSITPEIAAKVAAMQDGELDQWRSAIELERRKRKAGLARPATQEMNVDKENLYKAVRDVVALSTGSRTQPYHVFAVKHGQDIARCYDHLKALENQVMAGRSLRRPERMKLYRAYAMLTCRWLQGIPDGGPPITESVVLRLHDRFVGLLERAYPGYGASEMGWGLLFQGKGLG